MAGFRKAERRKAKLRLGMAGPSGSGKTAGALLIAYGITGDWGKIGLVDTENGSGELYVNSYIGDTLIGEYNVLTMNAPYGPEKYVQAIKIAEQEGLELVILDSLSHAWAGEGGLLDLHDKITKASKSGNSWKAWRDVTPKHNALVEAMLSSKIHIIATMRSKVEHIQTEENGKKVIKKVGMAPIQRDGMEYEMTVFLDIDTSHITTASKDRTGLFDGEYFTITPKTGEALKEWLETGTDAPPQVVQQTPVQVQRKPRPINGNGSAPKTATQQQKKLFAAAKEAGVSLPDLKELLKEATGKESTKNLTAEEFKLMLDVVEAKKEAEAV